MCFTKVTQSYFIVDNLQFKKILLHVRIIKRMPQRGQILSCKCTTSHALGAQCNQWNVDYHIHPTQLFCSGFKLCRTIFMPPTSKKLRGHIGLGLSVCPSVRLTVCPSVRLSVCPSVRLSVTPYVGCKTREPLELGT